MDFTALFRRFSYPVLGVALAFISWPGDRLLSSTTAAVVPSGDLVQGYRDLWASDIPGASTRLLSALRADPASAERWADFAEVMTESDNSAAARQAITQSIAASPGLPHIRMRAANLSLRIGDTERALRESAIAVSQSHEYAEAAFQMWVRLGGGADAVFRSASPSASLAREYFLWLVATGPRPDVTDVWAHLYAAKLNTRTETSRYADFLVAHHEYSSAAAILGELHSADGNLILNGGFEEPLDENFPGWRFVQPTGLVGGRDESTHLAGNAAFRVRFTGTNGEFVPVTQRVAVSPGVYRLTASLRAEALTSQQGVSMRLSDADDPNHFAISPSVSGDQPWKTVETSLSVGPAARLLEIAVYRRAAWNFDTPVTGTVWVDNVRLARLRDVQ